MATPEDGLRVYRVGGSAKGRCIFGKIGRAEYHGLADGWDVVSPASNDKSESSVVPAVDEVVLVQCDHFRCLAFRDKHGKWRSPFSKMELTNVLHVIERNFN